MKPEKSKGNLRDLEPGDYFSGIVKVIRAVKPGPFILNVYDGTAIMEAVIRDSVFQEPRPKRNQRPNEMTIGNVTVRNPTLGNVVIKDSSKKNRPAEREQDSNQNSEPMIRESDIKVGKVFELKGECQSRGKDIQIEVESIVSSTYDFNSLLALRSTPLRESFSITSERYEKMKPTFLAVAKRIRLAILQSQPILIRHHNDADGICAGLAVEKACRMFIEQCQLSPDHMIYRSPSISPFYDPIDLFRDISMFQRYSQEHGDPSPLILLLDTGSTPENLFCMKILQTFNYECVIVDHHNPATLKDGKSQVCPYVSVHLNPYLFGYDNQTCAGMLCHELARFIFETYEQTIYPAVAGLADRCKCTEIDDYVKISSKSVEELTAMGIAIDYLAFHFKFDSGVGVYERVYKDQALVNVINQNVRASVETQLESTLPYLKSEDINGVFYSEIELDQYTQRFKYPTPGKVLGMVHDHVANSKANQPVITIGYFEDGVIIRATKSIIPIPTLLEDLQRDMPEANVEGGGHETAGSLKFIPAKCQAVLTYIKDALKKATKNVSEN